LKLGGGRAYENKCMLVLEAALTTNYDRLRPPAGRGEGSAQRGRPDRTLWGTLNQKSRGEERRRFRFSIRKTEGSRINLQRPTQEKDWGGQKVRGWGAQERESSQCHKIRGSQSSGGVLLKALAVPLRNGALGRKLVHQGKGTHVAITGDVS